MNAAAGATPLQVHLGIDLLGSARQPHSSTAHAPGSGENFGRPAQEAPNGDGEESHDSSLLLHTMLRAKGG
eukprot:1150275-Pelagomonas_calceolata.AAC.2